MDRKSAASAPNTPTIPFDRGFGWSPLRNVENLDFDVAECMVLNDIFGEWDEDDIMVMSWHGLTMFFMNVLTNQVVVSHIRGIDKDGTQLWTQWETSPPVVYTDTRSMH